MGAGLFFGGGTILSLGRAPLEACGCAAPKQTCCAGGSRDSLLGPLDPPPWLALPWVEEAPRLIVAPRLLGRAPRHLPLRLAAPDPLPFSWLCVPWLHPRYSGRRTSWAASACLVAPPCAPAWLPGALSGGRRSLPQPSVIIYLWPKTDLISLMSSSGSHESSTWAGSHCLLSNPMSSSTCPAPVSIQGINARMTGKISLATGGNLVRDTIVISSTP